MQVTGGAGAPIAVRVGAATDTGLRRRVNEDSFLAQAPLFLVADGMGGHLAGEVASAAVIAAFAGLAGRPSLSVHEMRAAFDDARRRVAGLPPGAGAGAGTTLTGVAVADVDGEGYWLAVNLGDSRTYRLGSAGFEQISVDHSVVQELIDSGELDAADAAKDSRRHVITRAIGAGSASSPDYWLLPAEAGDRLLICSDGLTAELDDARILQILREEADPQAAALRLVDDALAAGGRDNITTLVVDALSVAGRGGTRAPDLDDTAPGFAAAEDVEGDTLPRVMSGGGN
ncbi:PP2C family protein-serine/threonine phosphatase [Microbacterium aureliae]